MGCGTSSEPAVVETVKQADASPPTSTAASVAPPAGSAKGKGKGQSRGKGKGKGKGNKIDKASKFQVELGHKWEDYGKEEDAILKRAFLVGQKHAKFHLRGQDYEYNFESMIQKNVGTRKERKIRPPWGMFAPQKPILPPGPMTVIAIPEGHGDTIEINDPSNPGRKIVIALPPGAKAGKQMAVPVPEKGEDVQAVAERQKKWGAGTKAAVGLAGAGAVVGGVMLGDHLSGGAVGDWVEGAAADVGEWAEGAAVDVGEWAAGAAEDIADWGAGAVETVGEAAEGALADAGIEADDLVDWLGDAGTDAGDFVMSLF